MRKFFFLLVIVLVSSTTFCYSNITKPQTTKIETIEKQKLLPPVSWLQVSSCGVVYEVT